MAVATALFIIGTVISTGTKIGMGVAQSRETDRANREARRIANQDRKDTLLTRMRQNRLQSQDIALGEKKLAYSEQISAENEAIRQEEKQDIGREASIDINKRIGGALTKPSSFTGLDRRFGRV